MDYKRSEWNGFERLDFVFEGHPAILVLPKAPVDGNKWMLKTEYFGAFPGFELEMLAKGYYLAYVESETRWHGATDDDTKERFCTFLQQEFSLCGKCLPVGMSCGGMQAVYFAAKYPRRVAALYLDAPVMNLLSCPVGVGMANDELYADFVAKTGRTKSELINFRNHPIDNLEPILENRIPVYLICGDSDDVVPFEENGKVLYERFKARGADISLILKSGCGHHPHGLEDNTPLLDFVARVY